MNSNSDESKFVTLLKHLLEMLTTVAPKQRHDPLRRRELPHISRSSNVNEIISQITCLQQGREA
jgi:hypothetical protein